MVQVRGHLWFFLMLLYWYWVSQCTISPSTQTGRAVNYSNSPMLAFNRSGTIDVYNDIQHFLWLQEIQTQGLMPVKEMHYKLDHLPGPLRGCFWSRRSISWLLGSDFLLIWIFIFICWYPQWMGSCLRYFLPSTKEWKFSNLFDRNYL